MSNETKNKIVPKLRFPEFREVANWNETTLGEVTFSVSEKNRGGEKYPIYSINNIEGFLPQSEQFEGVNSHDRGYDVSLYKLIQRNTFAYNPARINIGSLGYSGDLHNIIISSLYVCFKTTKDVDDVFLLYFLKSDIFNKSVKRSIEGGIRSYLFYENFSKIKIQFPSILEQQKIADCLFSLDELITAQSQKLQALKTHKKGMMQQLFPAEGETVPKLRFAEFRDSGEWELRKLGAVAEMGRGKSKHRPRDASTLFGGIYPFIQTGDIKKAELYLTDYTQTYSEEGLKQSKLWSENTLCITIAANIAETAILKIKACFPDSVIGLTPKADKSKVLFVKYLFDNFKIQIQRESQGMAQDNLNQEKLSNMEFFFPSLSEQQKIADCLSSLDEQISAQTEKIEALKVHKKGLMQALFPSEL